MRCESLRDDFSIPVRRERSARCTTRVGNIDPLPVPGSRTPNDTAFSLKRSTIALPVCELRFFITNVDAVDLPITGGDVQKIIPKLRGAPRPSPAKMPPCLRGPNREDKTGKLRPANRH